MESMPNVTPFILTDRTREVEVRLRAIHVMKADSCSFFRAQDETLFCTQNCSYCIYAKFSEGEHTFGLCKFRP